MTPKSAFNILYKFKYIFIWLVLLGAIALWPGVQKSLLIDNSLKIWFLDSDPALLDYHQFQKQFGNDELVILMLENREQWKNQAQLLQLKTLCQQLEKHPDVANVLGVGNAQIVQNTGFGLIVVDLIQTDSTIAFLNSALSKSPFLQQQLFSENFSVTRIIIQLKASADFDDRRGQILQSIKALSAEHFSVESQHWGGIGIIYEGLNSLSQQDFGFFLMGGYLLMFVCLWLIFKSFRAVLLALGVVFLSTWYCLGIYGAFGLRLNLMTTLLPLIIILLGVLDIVHIIYVWQNLSAKSNTKERLTETLKHTWKPCLFTSLTTMAGFMTLLSSSMPILKTFGLFAALGIFFCLIFTWVLCFILLEKVKVKNNGWLVNIFKRNDWESKFSESRFWKFISIVLIAAAAYGSTKIIADTYTYGYFPKDHQVVKDHEFMQSQWGPYLPLELVMELPKNINPYDPQFIQKVNQLDSNIRLVHGIGDFVGVHQIIKSRLYEKYNTRLDKALKSKVLLKQSYDLSQQYYPQLMSNYISKDERLLRFTIFGSMSSSKELKHKTDSIVRMANAIMGPLAKVKPTGYQPMYSTIVDYVAASQISSLAFVLIFLLLWVSLSDVRLALLTLIANAVPLLFMFGVMGFFKIRLDSATASIAAIVLSFCIDDTIHFTHYYKRQLCEGNTPDVARKLTMVNLMPVIIITSLLILIGYGMMSFGSLKTVQNFGILSSIAVLGALYSQMIIFPWMLRFANR